MHKILFTGGENIFTEKELKELEDKRLEITILPLLCRGKRINK